MRTLEGIDTKNSFSDILAYSMLEDMRTLEGIDTVKIFGGMESILLEDMRTLEGIDTPHIFVCNQKFYC